MALRSPQLPSMMQHMAFDEQRQFSSSRPRTQFEPVELPSIRQAVPEIQTTGGREPYYRTDSARQPSPFSSRFPMSEHNRVSDVMSKRQRMSPEDGYDSDPRDSMARRRSRSPTQRGQRSYRTASSPSSDRRTSIQSTTDSRNGSTRTSPYTQARGLPPIRSSSMESVGSQRQDWRPTLPSLPALTFDQGMHSLVRKSSTVSDYSFGSARSAAQAYPPATNGYEPSASYFPPGYPAPYHPRGQSCSGPSTRERTPFSSNHHQYSASSNFPYTVDVADSGNEGKQRKRRGNLPKETTDKLRAWFLAHIQHPYPTEDEKQDLMRQTGLQMNQISNWFINARRRQLPTMMNNAKAEVGARLANGPKPTNSNEMMGSSQQRSNGTTPESDGGGSGYDEEFANAQMSRGF